jgi:hypothetical protein
MATGTPPPLWDAVQHPLLKDSACPNCDATPGRLAIVTDYFLYLRCDDCSQVWSQPERRARKRLNSSATSRGEG